MIRAHLLGTTFLQSAPYAAPASRTAERYAISKAVLGREPIVLCVPGTQDAFWVEGEPDNWREFLAAADQGEMPEVSRITKRGMH